MPSPLDDAQTNLIHQLVDAAARDVMTYRNADDPNRFTAGQAALSSIDAAARALQEVRAALANELFKIDRPESYVAGNAGPGF